jgi:hypothetical protein
VEYELGFYIPKDDILHSHRCENLKPCIATLGLTPIPTFRAVSQAKVNLSMCFIKYTPRHEDVWGSGGIALLFFIWTLDDGERTDSRPGRFASYEKSSWYSLGRRLGGSQTHFGPCGEETAFCSQHTTAVAQFLTFTNDNSIYRSTWVQLNPCILFRYCGDCHSPRISRTDCRRLAISTLA